MNKQHPTWPESSTLNSFRFPDHFNKALKHYAKEQTEKTGHRVSQSTILRLSALVSNPRLRELDEYYKRLEAVDR